MTSPRTLRRHAVALGATISVLLASSGFVAARATADQVGSLRAEAAAIAARISALGLQESALAEKYDQARGDLAGVKARVAAAEVRVARSVASAGAARSILQTEAVNAYISNGSGGADSSSGAPNLASADAQLLRAEYQQSLATTQADSVDRYRLASKVEATAEADLKTQQRAVAAQVATISRAASQVQATQAQLTGTEQQVKGQLAAAVQAAQAAAAAAAARQEAARLAAEQVAAAAAAATTTTVAPAGGTTGAAPTNPVTTGGTTSPTTAGSTTSGVTTPPTTAAPSTGSSGGATTSGGGAVSAPSGVAAAAVAAAESRVGDEYVWGAAGPSTFDCSGLVMWAYAQAGVSLPHYSGAQYADTTHISMADLQPGDLVFPADPGEHVAMYVGSGEIVEAPYTGATVHIVPLSSFFVYASRVG